MRKVSVILALLSCVCLIGCPSAIPRGLVGKWLYMEDPSGSGKVIKLDFRSAGRFSMEIISPETVDTPQAADRLAYRGTYVTDTTVTPNELTMQIDEVGEIVNGRWKWELVPNWETISIFAIYELQTDGKLKMEVSEDEMPTEFTENVFFFTRQ